MVEKVLATLGGTLETAYFTFGDDDFIGIAEIPDHASAVSLTVATTGAAFVKTTVLLTPEELDEAPKKTVDYTPPGQ